MAQFHRRQSNSCHNLYCAVSPNIVRSAFPGESPRIAFYHPNDLLQDRKVLLIRSSVLRCVYYFQNRFVVIIAGCLSSEINKKVGEPRPAKIYTGTTGYMYGVVS